MVDYIVTNTQGGANLRSQPNTSSSFRNLPFGSALFLINDTGGKWKYVQTEAGDTGYVSEVNITKPASDAVTRLVRAAAYYWEAFSFGSGEEDEGQYYDIVVQMWRDLNQGMPPKKKIKKNGVEIEVYDTSHPDWPWSAAGMSAFIRKAGGYDGFKFSTRHATYVHDSIVCRKNGDESAPFWGYRIDETPIRVGDLVVQWRGVKQTYASASTSNDFKSHTDVVCDIKSGQLYAIGANVDKDTVGLKRYQIDGNGYLRGPNGTTSRDKTVFMLMRNIAK